MRAPLLRSASIRAGILGGILVAAGFAACADAIHLDPPSPDAGAGTTSTGGGTGGCHSNPDCAYPTPVCDTVSRKCVGCLTASDCSFMPGTVCSLGKCACPSTKETPLTLCVGETPLCVDTETSPTNCGACGKVCTTNCDKGKCASPATSSSVAASTAASTSAGSGGQGVGGSATGSGGADGG